MREEGKGQDVSPSASSRVSGTSVSKQPLPAWHSPLWQAFSGLASAWWPGSWDPGTLPSASSSEKVAVVANFWVVLALLSPVEPNP